MSMNLSRRRVLAGITLLASGAVGSALLSACSSSSPASPTAAPTQAAGSTTSPTAAATTAAASTAAPTTAPASSPTAAPTTAPSAQSSTSAPSGGGTIEVWDLHPEWKDAMTAVVAAFNKKYPNITVNVTAYPADSYQNQVQTALNAGLGPDVFQANPRPQLDQQSSTGQLLDLTGRVDESAWTSIAKDASIIKGKVWAVAGGKYSVGIAYHTDVFEKAGITAEPKTWAELTDAFNRLKAIKVIPYAMAAKDGSHTGWTYMGLASSVLGVDGFNAVLQGTRKLTDPDLVAVIQQMMDWSKFYEPAFIGTGYTEGKALFATGKASSVMGGSSDFNGYREINPNGHYGYMYWPGPDAQHKPCTVTGMELTVAVNSKTKNTEASVAFVSWLGTPDGAQVMTDNVRDLPVVSGVKPQDSLQAKMLATPEDIPAWFERFPTLNVTTVWTDQGQAPFEGKMTAAQFAKLLQNSVDAQLALAAKQQ